MSDAGRVPFSAVRTAPAAVHVGGEGDLTEERPATKSYDSAEIGALAHLYRGEVHRSTIWRTRLDTTTNWAVVTTGLALSLAFSSPEASSLPLALVGLLVALFLFLEARRYRYFDMWRLRTRVLENHFFNPILLGETPNPGSGWSRTLSDDYLHPSLHIGLFAAMGRRLRRNYGWIFSIQVIAYAGKLLIHPTTIASVDQLWDRATIGPVPGELVLVLGVLFHATWIAIAVATWKSRRGTVRSRPMGTKDDEMLELSAQG